MLVSHFCDLRLGKGVVLAKDTPNFIANRIGTFSVLNVMRLMQELDLTIEGRRCPHRQAVGWPKSATFRTIDLVGLDILSHVVANMTGQAGAGPASSPADARLGRTLLSAALDERSDLKLPDFYKQMLDRNGSETKPKEASTKN